MVRYCTLMYIISVVIRNANNHRKAADIMDLVGMYCTSTKFFGQFHYCKSSSLSGRVNSFNTAGGPSANTPLTNVEAMTLTE